MSTFFLFATQVTLFGIAHSYLDSICISNSIRTNINGRYLYHSWNWPYNSPIYLYNNSNEEALYLYPYVTHEGDHRYVVGSTIDSSNIWSYCHIPGPYYSMSPLECDNNNDGDLITLSTSSIQRVNDTATLTKCSTFNDDSASGIPINTISSTESRVLTEKYGNTDSTASTHIYMKEYSSSTMNQVNGITSWGISLTEWGLADFSWETDGYSANDKSIGNDTEVYPCSTTFLLNNGEYINGYRVFYDTKIRGLTFYHFDKSDNTFISYECLPDGAILDNYIDSGIIYYPNYYLSGFIFNARLIIENIQFEFNIVPYLPSFLDDYCIISDTNSEQGIYQYYTWDYSLNGPIYFNWESSLFLYPWSDADPSGYNSIGITSYKIGDALFTSGCDGYCDIPSISSPKSPEQCLSGSEYMVSCIDDNLKYGKLTKCNSTQGLVMRIKDGRDTVITKRFGGTRYGSHVENYTDHGAIRGISSWGYGAYGALSKVSWTIKEGNTMTETGINTEYDPFRYCTPFDLEEGEYINGYRVIYDDIIFVYGLVFYIISDDGQTYKSYSCFAGSINHHHYNDSGIVYYPNLYLSGFIFNIDDKDSGSIIDGINLQFSPLETCITGAVNTPIINGGYEYYAWDASRNGGIYYNAVQGVYLYPDSSVYSSGNRYYFVSNQIGDSNDNIYGYCRIPLTAAGMSIYDCYNDYGFMMSSIEGDDKVDINRCQLSSSDGIYVEVPDTTTARVTMFYNDSRSMTRSYGSWDLFGLRNYTNEGKIMGISSWGLFLNRQYPWYGAIGKLSWIKEDGTASDIIGDEEYFQDCDPFTLDSNEKIDGYRVIYGDYIYGLVFHTSNENVYSCIMNGTNNVYNNSGLKFYANGYLSGFQFSPGKVIDGIRFQFTHIPGTNNNNIITTKSSNYIKYLSFIGVGLVISITIVGFIYLIKYIKKRIEDKNMIRIEAIKTDQVESKLEDTEAMKEKAMEMVQTIEIEDDEATNINTR